MIDRWWRMPELRESIHATGPGQFGVEDCGILALVNEHRLRRILTRMLDENEFLSPYGIRSLSQYHHDHPYVISAGPEEFRAPRAALAMARSKAYQAAADAPATLRALCRRSGSF